MGNPFANWAINNQYPNEAQPQATAPEFGATLPGETTPPDNGQGGTVKITKQEKVTVEGWKGWTPGQAQIRVKSNNGSVDVWSKFQDFTLPDVVSDDIRGIQIVIPLEKEVGTENPSPPPVVYYNPLPQGALFVDLSANNKTVDLATQKANGVQGVGIRLSNGIRKNTDTTDENGVDKMAWYYIEQAAALNMPWLGYHFSNENYDDVEQVRHFLGIAQQAIDAGYIPEMGLWLDFETPAPPIQGSPKTEVRIQLQLTTLANERPTIIGDYGPYTSVGWWNEKVTDVETWATALGLKSWVSAWPDKSVLVDGYPPAWWKPFNLKGFATVHYWQWTSTGGALVGHSVDSLDLNYVGNTASAPTPPTPPADTVDILSYMIGTHQQQHTLQYTWNGGGTQTIQIMQSGNEWQYVKGGGQYERLYFDNAWIYRAEDTSESPERFYTHSTNGTLGAAWVKRFMTVGETVYTSKDVQHYLKAGCVPQDGGLVTDALTLTAVYPSYTFESGITLPDVIRLEWQAGEGYLFAKGYGLVGFEFSGGKSYISELALQGRDDLPIVVPGCIDLSGRFYV